MLVSIIKLARETPFPAPGLAPVLPATTIPSSAIGLASHNTTGSQNIFVGAAAGINNKTGKFDIYVGNPAPYSGTESSTIRIGSPGYQSATYIAGIDPATNLPEPCPW